MAATFDGVQRTRLDPITLAAFKDTGWYQVNHSASEELLWGQGAGIEFGLVTTCGNDSSDFFCTGRCVLRGWGTAQLSVILVSLYRPFHSGLGCHYLHLDKGNCSSDPMLEGCRMYKPLANGSECWKKENGLPAGVENPHGEIYHSQSRCFLANLSAQPLPGDKTSHSSRITHLKEAELTGRCYLHQCTQREAYVVRVAGSPWVPCLPGKHIKVGVIRVTAVLHWQKEIGKCLHYYPICFNVPFSLSTHWARNFDLQYIFSSKENELVIGAAAKLCYVHISLQIPGYSGLLFCPQGRLCRTNEGTNAVTSAPLSLSTQDLLFQLPLELAGSPGYSLGKGQREELAEAVLQALVNRSGAGR
ncbi:PREDICTED: uncharacterized protein LOC102025218 isoform X1 [Chinchilla lanigera]|uniref:uncharacterized protein LOC102025218 isoform X1 n=1 Tax=Chinchilla lanigera TaxID=34839 RepID=UPI00038ED44C|nr:PREDICTED: uncharacterized protein LOC102025218 isoform X1 [Chinchilla lanigera]